MTTPLLEAHTPIDPLAEYRQKNPCLAQGWLRYAQLLIEELDRTSADQKQSGMYAAAHDHSSQSQLDAMADAAKISFDSVESAMYLNLRVTQTQIAVDPEQAGAEPRKLSDQRLMIEICVIAGDYNRARALIVQYPSVRAA